MKRQQSYASNQVALTPSPRTAPVAHVSNEQLKRIESMHNFANKKTMDEMKKCVFQNPTALREIVTVGYFGGKVSYEFFRTFNNVCSVYVKMIIACGANLNELSPRDKKMLMEKNSALVNRYKAALFLDDDESCFSKGIECYAKSGDRPELEDLSDRLKSLELQGQKPVISHKAFYPANLSPEDEARQLELSRKMKLWPRDTPDGPIDEVQSTLMRLMLASSPDFLDLERPDLVAKAQLKFVTHLQGYLKSKYGNEEARKRFADALMLSAYAREANDIIERAMNAPQMVVQQPEVTQWQYC